MSVHKIYNELAAKCPYCYRPLDLNEVGVEIFYRILEKLRDGEKIEIQKFGIFRTTLVKPREVEGLHGKTYLSAERRVIRFRASVLAKEFINRDKEKGDDNEIDDRD
jgi:nucleoid DNA-binding protein